MGTQRYISTGFWDDEWVQSLEPLERYLFVYLLTNTLTNIAGIYKITNKRISFDTGLQGDELEKMMGRFEASGKAYRKDGFIILPNWPKHQKWKTNANIKAGIETVLKGLPPEMISFLKDIGYLYPMDSPSTPMDSPSTLSNYSDLDSNLDSDLDIDSDLDGDSKPAHPDCGKPVEKPKTTTTFDLHNLVKEKIKAQGFYVDDPVVQKIIKAVSDTERITGKYDIITFAAGKINGIYPDKPKEDRRKLFISALTKWDNIKDEYPDWRDKKTAAEAAAVLEKLRDTPPPNCPHCNTGTGGRKKCPECGGFVEFSEEKKEWVYVEPFDIGSLIRERKKQGTEAKGVISDNDIDF